MVDTSRQTIEGGPQPVGEASSDSTISPYTIRRFHSGDAAGVTRLVEGVYGDTYYPRELYNPDKIVELNEAEKLVSVVTLDSAGEVIGHYALERPDLGAVAEASDAIVAVGYRHHHLLEEMRPVLREEAKRLGLTGLVGRLSSDQSSLFPESRGPPRLTPVRGGAGIVAALVPQHAGAADAADEFRCLLRLREPCDPRRPRRRAPPRDGLADLPTVWHLL